MEAWKICRPRGFLWQLRDLRETKFESFAYPGLSINLLFSSRVFFTLLSFFLRILYLSGLGRVRINVRDEDSVLSSFSSFSDFLADSMIDVVLTRRQLG